MNRRWNQCGPRATFLLAVVLLAGWMVPMASATGAVSGLPSHFDWRDFDKVTPVQNQRDATCWAYATTATFEAKLKIQENLTDTFANLSEQWLISHGAGDCRCRDFWAFPAMWDESHCVGCILTPGARREWDCERCYNNQTWYNCLPPLQGCVPCGIDAPVYRRIEGWGYVDGVEDGCKPSKGHPTTVEQMKKYIYAYGPVASAMASPPQDYTGGVYDGTPLVLDSISALDDVGHAVLVVGWDDADSCYYVKNSKGCYWGEQGYMRCKYDNLLVGAQAAYLWGRVDPLTLISPNGGESWTARSTHSIIWRKYYPCSAYGITGIKLELLKAGAVVSTIASSLPASDTLYSWSIPETLAPGTDYQIRVSSTGEKVLSDASDGFFTIVNDAPPAVEDLSARAGRYTAILQWTAPDDGESGTASEYDLRRSTSPITEGNFSGATRVTTSAPQAPGSTECVRATSLITCATHYFALKTRDAAGQWSAISNVPSASTTCSGILEPQCQIGDRLQPVANDDALPAVLSLGAPRPNPARDLVSVRFDVPARAAGGPLELAVFDVSGRRVATLADGPAVPGNRSAVWNVGASATRVRSGIYFVRLRLGETRLTRSVQLVR